MDEAAFGAFFDSTVGEVYRYATRLAGRDRAAAEDLVQDAYAAYARELRAGRVEQVGVGWLITVVRNRHIDALRRAGTEQRRGVLVAMRPAVELEPGIGVAAALLEGLPADQRTALVLRYVDDLPVPDVAATLGRSVHATESLLARAREAVRRKGVSHG